MHHEQDLQTFAQLGAALWVVPECARPVVIETFSAVSLLELSEECALDRAIGILLQRAEGMGAIEATRTSLLTGQFGNPFYKLSPAERFVLIGLHSGHWSYARLGRIMGLSVDEIEILAWNSRLKLSSAAGRLSNGPKTLGHSCPEYDFERPWTQKFLDQEIKGGQERHFLQNHVMACDICRVTLNQCRDLCFNVEKMLPALPADEQAAWARELGGIQRRGLKFRDKSFATAGDAFLAMFRERDIQLWVLLGSLFCLYRFFH